jgi:hypothetical protein
MHKIPTLFIRDEQTRQVVDRVTPGAEWVIEGLGTPTRKIDGTSCLYQNGTLYKRYDAKAGKAPPAGFIPAQEPDPVTQHWPGWLAIGDGPEDRWHREALALLKSQNAEIAEWTYELIGPKVQGNAEHVETHQLIRHGSEVLDDLLQLQYEGRLSFEIIKEYLASHSIEGIVWWRTLDDMDADKVKLKRRDLGLPWPIKS